MHKFDCNQPASCHNPFKVPEGYFTEFAERLMSRIDGVETRMPQMRFVAWIPWIGVACVLALTLLFTQWMPSSTTQSSKAKQEQYAAREAADDEAVYDYLMMANADNSIMSYENDY